MDGDLRRLVQGFLGINKCTLSELTNVGCSCEAGHL